FAPRRLVDDVPRACRVDELRRERVLAAERGVDRGRRGTTGEAADVRDELTNVLVAEARERRHLRSGDAGADRAPHIVVAGAVREASGVQRGRAIALPAG